MKTDIRIRTIFGAVLLIAAGLAVTTSCTTKRSPSDLLSQIDHLVYATPDLDRGIEEIERLLGIRAAVGGRHPGRGTRNALIGLGPNVYLEIIAPDPDQPAPSSPRAFGIDGLTVSKLAGWSARSASVDSVRREAVAKGVPLGEVKSGSRQRPDGVVLSWRFTDSATTIADGLVPFFIDWESSPHPSLAAPKGAILIGFRAEHPDERRVGQMLHGIGLDLQVTHGSQPSLIAIIDGPRGRIELR